MIVATMKIINRSKFIDPLSSSLSLQCLFVSTRGFETSFCDGWPGQAVYSNNRLQPTCASHAILPQFCPSAQSLNTKHVWVNSVTSLTTHFRACKSHPSQPRSFSSCIYSARTAISQGENVSSNECQPHKTSQCVS